MGQEVYKNIYLEELELPKNPLKYLNWYIIKGEKKNIIVDTGFDREDTRKIVQEHLRNYDLHPDNTILFLTHLHSDHTGLASFYQEEGFPIYMSHWDGEDIRRSIDPYALRWTKMVERSIKQGLAVDKLEIDEHPGFRYRPKTKIDYIEVLFGDRLDLGNYVFEVIDLSGHTPGQVGLYERKHQLLFCGDHILAKITPNITYWGEEVGDSLGQYLKNLDKIFAMEVKHLFSSHRYLVKDHRQRIEELKNHHQKRVKESLSIVKKLGKASVRDVTIRMHWDIRSKSWKDFPNSQKWFAAGEAQAHLEYLKRQGKIEQMEEDGVWYYRAL